MAPSQDDSLLDGLKGVAKGLVPAPVWAELHRRRRGPKLYLTWAAAVRAAGAYDSDVLNRFRVARRPKDVDVLAADHPLALALKDLPPAAAPTIVDLGGGTGELMRAALLRWPSARCAVVETPGLVALLRHYGPISFGTEIPENAHVFHIGGTLQYLSRPYTVLARCFAAASHSVVLTRNSLSDRTIIRVQETRLFENGSGPVPTGFLDRSVSYPHRTVRESLVTKIAKRAGFRLEWQDDDPSGALPYFGMVYGKNMIFRKVTPTE